MAKVKIIIEDGIISEVLSNDKNIEVEIVDFDKNRGNYDLLQKEYESGNELVHVEFSINHCEEEECS